MACEVQELEKEGLRRRFAVVVDREEIDRRMQMALMDLRDKVRLKGFRPGKAPLSLLEKLYGEAIFGEVAEETIKEHTERLFRDRKLRPALQPDVSVEEADREKGIRYEVTAEVLPEIDVSGFEAPAVERLVAEITDEDVDAALARLAEQAKRYEPADAKAKAAEGDMVVIDFEGRIDGEPFEGGRGEGAQLILGAGQFLPGFEEGLVGAKAGETREVEVTFPDDYPRSELAGRTAQFSVTVKEVRKPVVPEVDDALAQQFGLTDLEALKKAVRDQLEQEARELSRQAAKRLLLDELAARYDFPVPEGMVALEYRQIWEQIKRDMIASGAASAEELEGKEEPEDEAERKEFRAIAERRVRLGLLLSEVGLANNIEISRDELMRKVAEEARRFPGQERQVYEFYTKNPQAMAQLRAPIYEDKVVDFVLEMAPGEQRTVSLATLRRVVEEGPEALETADEAGSAAKTGTGRKKKAAAGKKEKTDKKAQTAAGKKSSAKTTARKTTKSAGGKAGPGKSGAKSTGGKTSRAAKTGKTTAKASKTSKTEQS
ncbi:MAG: trigger factor [Alphaproteobacteria bacterium]|nr:MAG: trigger factor [Alphaproteobacteria bacterium]